MVYNKLSSALWPKAMNPTEQEIGVSGNESIKASTSVTGRPAEYTEQQIVNAGNELIKAGRNVTGFALRQKLGGGNAARLRDIWGTHLNSSKAASDEVAVELPIEVSEQLQSMTAKMNEQLYVLANELNKKTVRAAERRVAEILKSSSESVSASERELADASQTVDDLEENLNQCKSDIQSLKGELEKSRQLEQQQKIEIAQLKERLAAQETNHKQVIHNYDLEITKVQSQLSETTSSLMTTKQELAESEANTVILTKTNDRLSTTVENQNIQLNEFKVKVATAEDKLKQYQTSIAEQDKKIAALSTQAQSNETAIADYKIKLGTAEAQVKQQQKTLLDSDNQIHKLTSQIDKSDQVINDYKVKVLSADEKLKQNLKTISEKDKHIEQLNAQNQQNEKNIIDLKETIARQVGQLDILQKQDKEPPAKKEDN